MNLVAVYDRQPAIRSSGLLRSALVTAQRSGDGKPDRFLARFSHKLSSIIMRQHFRNQDLLCPFVFILEIFGDFQDRGDCQFYYPSFVEETTLCESV